MLLVDKCHINSEHKMVSDTLQINHHLTNGEAENNLHRQSEKTLCQPLNGSLGEVSSLGFGANRTHTDEESVDILEVTTRDSAATSNSNSHLDVIAKTGKRQNDMTLEDIYNKEYNFDDDDDDSDWDPLEKNIEVLKWFCVNCTMVNFDDVVHCDVCGEHRESGILRHGFHASPFLPEQSLDPNGSELIESSKGSCSQNVAPNNSTVVGFDERMLLHAEVEMKPHPHPERPDRLRAIAASLATAGIFPGRCHPILAREITREELLMIHSPENIEAVELTSRMLASYFTPDTYANEHSARAARLAAGLCADLASTIFSGRAKNGFALVRPPGHHAGVKQAMGFCLHNNAAIAASAAQAAGAKKVLIVDWDVHHGNGTQEIFDQSKSVLYVSLHRHEGGKFYPGTGAADEVGTMGAEGYCVNIPWSRRGVGDKDYIYAFQHIVIPIASEFAPDFTIISAGFDAARGDPLGCCDVTPAGFAQMTEMLTALSGGKLLVILEGGYNLRSISCSATAVIKVLLGESPACNLDDIVPSKSGLRTIFEVLKIQTKYWPALESTFSKLQLRWGIYAFQDTGKQVKRRRKAVVPVWWRWGRKRLFYRVLSKQLQFKVK
ncbi:histone deacetylase 15 [Coffea eugenioides]|uniref:histone deacetylase 15 n=1 Tax=Coffea eugenioides TaxID=49369 RepID=UPI000F604EF2|nr:histone deacetylase 15 [Coffea eugenioides]